MICQKIYNTLKEVSTIVNEKMNGNFYDYIKELGVSSKYEVEIRASMIVVIDYIKKKLDNTYSIDINDYFFTASKKLKQTLKPYYLTRNTNY